MSKEYVLGTLVAAAPLLALLCFVILRMLYLQRRVTLYRKACEAAKAMAHHSRKLEQIAWRTCRLADVPLAGALNLCKLLVQRDDTPAELGAMIEWHNRAVSVLATIADAIQTSRNLLTLADDNVVHDLRGRDAYATGPDVLFYETEDEARDEKESTSEPGDEEPGDEEPGDDQD